MIPRNLARVDGPNLTLRLILPEDAAYVHSLRIDPAYNRHLSEVRGTVEEQRLWIEGYKTREAELLELYYVIERKDGIRCGVVRLYDIAADSFTWGSWILDHNKTPKAALESAVLSLGVGFDVLGLSMAHVAVQVRNEKARAFYIRFGMTEVRRNDRDIYFIYPCERFITDRAGFMAALA